MAKAKKLLHEMSFEELIDWSESEDSEEATPGDWSEFREYIEKKAPAYFKDKDFCELNKFYREHPQDDQPFWYDAWSESMLDAWPISYIFECINAIETTLDVILKKIGDEDAGISIKQLARLKSGYVG